MRLTDISIRNLKSPDEGASIFYDDQLAGFGVRVSKGGTKSFILTHGRLRARETIGRVGTITLQQARAEAKVRLAEYTLGKERPQSSAWDAAVNEYLDEVATKIRPRTHQSYEYALRKHFRYGRTKLSDLRPHDLHKNLGRLSDRPSEQQHAFTTIRAFLRWAYRKHYIERSPIERMRAPHPYVPRERVLSDQELKRVWTSAGDCTFGRLVKFLILTGQRVGETTRLTGSMIGGELVTIPASLAKNNREHRVPLAPMAASLLPLEVDPEGYLFTAEDGVTRFQSLSSGKRCLDARSGVMNWRLHDLRRTFASGMASIGVALPVTERLLNHVSGSFGGIVGVYQRYDFLPEMVDAITRWESHIRAMMDA